jgi:hypothetical protein
MKLTLLFRSNNARFIININKQKLLLGLLAISVLLLVSSRSTHYLDENIARIQYVKTGLDEQAYEVSLLKTNTEQRMAGMMLELADMQTQILRLDVLGSKLVQQAKLNPSEFTFNQIPSMDGHLDSSKIDIQVQDVILSRISDMLNKIQNKTQELSALESIMLSHHINGQSKLEGEPVLATGAGIITYSGSRYDYGELVEIDHGGDLVTLYGHNKKVNVKVGNVVTKGQSIAMMGSTGRSTGPHVHYEVIHKGKQQDPLPYVYRKSS